MTTYTVRMTPQARAAAMVALVSELERIREGQPTDDVGRRVRTQALSDLQAAIDSLRGAEPTEDHPTPLRDASLPELRARLGALVDDMPPEAVERTVGRVHDAYARFQSASQARKERETRS